MSTIVFGMGVYACTSVVVGKDASVDGSVMTTHTCDGWYDARCKWQIEMHLTRKTILHLTEIKKWLNPPLLFEF